MHTKGKGHGGMRARAFIGALRRKIFGDDADRIRALTAKVDSLEFFLKSMYDITKVPKASGVLRLIQLADLVLIKTVADILGKHGLAYWIESGTLLGAVRHGGFIPWDDDADLGMMRADRKPTILNLFCLRLLPCSAAKQKSERLNNLLQQSEAI